MWVVGGGGEGGRAPGGGRVIVRRGGSAWSGLERVKRGLVPPRRGGLIGAHRRGADKVRAVYKSTTPLFLFTDPFLVARTPPLFKGSGKRAREGGLWMGGLGGYL